MGIVPHFGNLILFTLKLDQRLGQLHFQSCLILPNTGVDLTFPHLAPCFIGSSISWHLDLLETMFPLDPTFPIKSNRPFLLIHVLKEISSGNCSLWEFQNIFLGLPCLPKYKSIQMNIEESDYAISYTTRVKICEYTHSQVYTYAHIKQ